MQQHAACESGLALLRPIDSLTGQSMHDSLPVRAASNLLHLISAVS